MSWYAVHTKPRAEPAVSHGLQKLGHETLYLHYKVTAKHARRTIEVLKPYFPRYLFVEATSGLYGIAKHEGVQSVVYGTNGPGEIPAEVIAELKRCADGNGLVDNTEIQHRIKPGTEIKITAGPLEGFMATILTDNGNLAKVLIDMFKGQVEAELLPAHFTLTAAR